MATPVVEAQLKAEGFKPLLGQGFGAEGGPHLDFWYHPGRRRLRLVLGWARPGHAEDVPVDDGAYLTGRRVCIEIDIASLDPPLPNVVYVKDVQETGQ